MTDKINAIIVDDEERGRNSLRLLLENYCPEIEILALVANVPEAVIAINKYSPALVFLDIEMPEYSGFELFQFFKEIDFEVIFVTAYDQYAVQAFQVSAIDYLLKPVDIDQLQAAVQKVKEQQNLNTIQQRLEVLKENYLQKEINRLALPQADGLKFIDINDIVFVEADGAYSHVFLNDQTKIMVSKKLRFFEEALKNKKYFFRSHRSFLPNINYITQYVRADNLLKMETGQSLSISRDKKAAFEQLLKELGLSIAR